MPRFGPPGRTYFVVHDIAVLNNNNTMSAAEQEWRTYEKAVQFRHSMNNATRSGHLQIIDNEWCPWMEFVKRVPAQYLIDTLRQNNAAITTFSLRTSFIGGGSYMDVPTTTSERRQFYTTIAHSLAELSQVTSITFKFDDLEGYEALSLFLRRRKTLQNLHVIVNNLFDTPRSDNLRRQLAANDTLRSITVEIDCNNITGQQRPPLLTMLPTQSVSLRHLEIRSYQFICTDTLLLNMPKIPPNLLTLRLKAPVPTNTLLKSLSESQCRLSTLAITCLPSTDASFLASVPAALGKLQHLKYLELRLHNLLPDTHTWCQILANYPLLQELRIFTRPAEVDTSHGLSPQEWGTALAHLQKSPSLHAVYICANFKPGTIGRNLLHCVSCLARDSGIRSLSLEESRVFDRSRPCIVSTEEGSTLVNMLRNNYTIQDVPFIVADLRESRKDIDIQTEAHTILALNRGGRAYMLEDQPSRTRGVKLLVTVRHDLNALYYHLLENPNLCSKEYILPKLRAPTATIQRKHAYPLRSLAKKTTTSTTVHVHNDIYCADNSIPY